MTYEIAIPSSNRSDRIGKYTLDVLRNGGVDLSRVTVFLPDESQAATYAPILEKYGVRFVYGHGAGVRQARNAIARHYPAGTDLVCVDDDIRSIHKLSDDGSKLLPMTDIAAAFERSVRESEGRLWCWYPVPNAFFMRHRVRRGELWYAEASLFGYRVTGDIDTELVQCDDKEDYERSCRFYLRDGEVVRFDNYTFRTKFYTEPGGMQDYRTPETILEGAARVCAMFPDLAKPLFRKNGRVDIRLRDSRR